MYFREILITFHLGLILPHIIRGLPSGRNGQNEPDWFDPEGYEHQRRPTSGNSEAGSSTPSSSGHVAQAAFRLPTLYELNNPSNRGRTPTPTYSEQSFFSFFSSESARRRPPVRAPPPSPMSETPTAIWDGNNQVQQPSHMAPTLRLDETVEQRLNDITQRINEFMRSGERRRQSSEVNNMSSLVERFRDMYNPPTAVDLPLPSTDLLRARIRPDEFNQTPVERSTEVYLRPTPIQPPKNSLGQTGSGSALPYSDILHHSRQIDNIPEGLTNHTPSTNVVESGQSQREASIPYHSGLTHRDVERKTIPTPSIEITGSSQTQKQDALRPSASGSTPSHGDLPHSSEQKDTITKEKTNQTARTTVARLSKAHSPSSSPPTPSYSDVLHQKRQTKRMSEKSTNSTPKADAAKSSHFQKGVLSPSSSSPPLSYRDLLRQKFEKTPSQEQPTSPEHPVRQKMKRSVEKQSRPKKTSERKSLDSRLIIPPDLCVLVGAVRGLPVSFDVVREVRRLNPHIEIIRTKVFPDYGEAMIACKTTDDVIKLRKSVATSTKVMVKSVNIFERLVLLHNIPGDVAKHELMNAIQARYNEKPVRVHLRRYKDGRTLQWARIGVGPALLDRMLESPEIKIKGSTLTIDTSIKIFRCTKCHCLAHKVENCWNEARPYPADDEACLDCTLHNTRTIQGKIDRSLRDTKHRLDSDKCESKQYFIKKWEEYEKPLYMKAESADNSEHSSSESGEPVALRVGEEDVREDKGAVVLETFKPSAEDYATTTHPSLPSYSSVASKSNASGPLTPRKVVDKSPESEDDQCPDNWEDLCDEESQKTDIPSLPKSDSKQIFSHATERRESPKTDSPTQQSPPQKLSFSEILRRNKEKELENAASQATSRYQILGKKVQSSSTRGRGSPMLNRVGSGGSTGSPRMDIGSPKLSRVDSGGSTSSPKMGIGSPRLNRVGSGGDTSSPRVASHISQEENTPKELPYDHGVLINPTSDIDGIHTLAEIKRLNKDNINFAFIKVFRKAVLVICESEADADRLRALVAHSESLTVKPFRTFPRQVCIPHITADITTSDIIEAIDAVHKETPEYVYLRPGDEVGEHTAVIPVGTMLLSKMEVDPIIWIRGHRLKIDTSVVVDRCINCQLLGHSGRSHCFNPKRSFPSPHEPCIDCTNQNEYIGKNTNQDLADTNHPTGDDRCPRKKYFQRKWERHQTIPGQ